MQGVTWIIGIENLVCLDMTLLKLKQLQHQYMLILQGIKLMKKTSGLMKWITNLHAAEGKPMSKLIVMDLCRMIELLKGFQFTFQKHIIPLVHCILLVAQHISYQALQLISATKVISLLL